MQPGFVSAILPDLTFEEISHVAQATGYSCIEVMCWPVGRAERRYAGVTHIDVSDFDNARATEIQRLCQQTGVEISALGYYPNPLSPDPGESAIAVEHIRNVIEATAMLKLPVMNTFTGRDWTKSINDNWPRFLKVWRPIIDFAEQQNVRVAIENCPMYFTKDEWPGGKNLMTSPAIWRRAFEDIDSDHFGLNFDPSHFIWQRMDYVKAIKEFSHKLFHIHAKDAHLDVQSLNEVGILAHPNDYHTPKLPGMGDVDWNRFFKALRDADYSGAVCVEIEDREYEGSLDQRKEALRISARYLNRFMG